jgi:purine-binding chemotaxis protein CheW
MEHSAQTNRQGDTVELATFFVGEAICGMDILKVQEINKLIEMTRVPKAPEYVLGILNLRGEIVTIIDLGKKLGLESTGINDKTRNIIVSSNEEHIGLMVEQICDVVQAEWDKVEKPPNNIGNVQGRFFTGVYKTEDRLIGILDVEKVLEDES